MIFKIKFIILFVSIFINGMALSFIGDDLKKVTSVHVITSVVPYTTLSVSTNKLSFNILGMPGDYISTDVVTLSVDSNQSTWGVYVSASNLKHKNNSIASLASDRISFSINDSKVFTPIKNNVLFLNGVVNSESKPVKLYFRLTTTWKDAPGVYKGKVTFSVLNNP